MENGNKNEPKGIFYFTHSAALQLLLSTLGYAKDSEPLVHDTNIDKAKTRKWYTANLTPFAANLAAIFYKYENFSASLRSSIYLLIVRIHFTLVPILLSDATTVSR